METTTIIFSDFGKNLGTRYLGQKIRKQTEDYLNAGKFVIFNFEDVNSISHSFADECFGKMLLVRDLEILKKQTTFKNIKDSIRRNIAFTLKERLKQISITEI